MPVPLVVTPPTSNFTPVHDYHFVSPTLSAALQTMLASSRVPIAPIVPPLFVFSPSHIAGSAFSSSFSPVVSITRYRTPAFFFKGTANTSFFCHRSRLPLVATADEEVFIHRNTSNRPTRKPPPSSAAPAEEEHFDFVQETPSKSALSDDRSPDNLPPLQPAPDSSLPSSSSVPSASRKGQRGFPHSADGTSEASTGDDTRRGVSEEALSSPSETNASAPSSSNGAAVKMLPNGSTFRLVDRIRRETTRIILESHLTPSIRFPTSRETITLAGELTFLIALLMILRAGVSSTLRWVHTRLNNTRGIKPVPPYESSVMECLQRPLEFLIILTAGTALAEAVSRPLAATGFLRHIRCIRELGIIIAATWFLLRWIDHIRARFAADMRTDKAQLDATARFATVATFVVSVLISLDTIGINVQTVLAFGGIGGVAIGFAGREIISNFFGGLMIYVTRPFTVGEWIRCIEESQLNGTVEDIGWYLTRIRSWDKRPLYIPNSRFSTLIVENGSRMDNRRIVHTLHLRLEDTPVVSTIVAQMESFLMNHPGLDPRQHRMVYVEAFDDYSVQVWFSCYTKSVFLYDFRTIQQELLLKFHDIIREAGAKLATRNTRDVRPGANVDRYGPLGPLATHGPTVSTTLSSVPTPPPSVMPPPAAATPSIPLENEHFIGGIGRNERDGGEPISGMRDRDRGFRQTEVKSSGYTRPKVTAGDAAHGTAAATQRAPPPSSVAAVAAAAAAAAWAAARRAGVRVGDGGVVVRSGEETGKNSSTGEANGGGVSGGDGLAGGSDGQGGRAGLGVGAGGATTTGVGTGVVAGEGAGQTAAGAATSGAASGVTSAGAVGAGGVSGAGSGINIGAGGGMAAAPSGQMLISTAPPRGSSGVSSSNVRDEDSGGRSGGKESAHGSATGGVPNSSGGSGNVVPLQAVTATAGGAGAPVANVGGGSGTATAGTSAPIGQMLISKAPPRGSSAGGQNVGTEDSGTGRSGAKEGGEGPASVNSGGVETLTAGGAGKDNQK